jgi:hypothetical protein
LSGFFYKGFHCFVREIMIRFGVRLPCVNLLEISSEEIDFPMFLFSGEHGGSICEQDIDLKYPIESCQIRQARFVNHDFHYF